MEDSGMHPSGKDYDGKTGLCSKDSDCSEGQTCKGNSCTDVCSPNPCSSGYKCIASGHSYTCAQCTADSDCASNKKCSNNICIDACSGNNCASQSKKCTTNSSHGYTCYGCTADAACPNDQRCDTRTSACVSICPSACPGQHCTVSGAHKATCSGCTSDEGCPSGQKCDTATNSCYAACSYTPAICAQEIGGYESDWTVAEIAQGSNQGSNSSQTCECSTKKRYVLMPNDKITYAGKTLYRIKAAKNFGSVKKGTLGGYIEKESNLEQSSYYGSSTAWVAGNAKVYGDAKVSSGGQVSGNAIVSGGTVSGGTVTDYATLSGGSIYGGKLYGNAKMTKGSLGDTGEIYGYAQNNGCMISQGSPKLYGNAVVTGCEMHENVQVYGNAKIHGSDVRLWGSVKVYDSAQIGTGGSQIYIKGKTNIYGNAKVYAKKNWTASSGYQHQVLEGNNLNIGGTVKFCDNAKKSGTYTSGTLKGSWEKQCNPPF